MAIRSHAGALAVRAAVAASAWRIDDGRTEVEAGVPPNSTARVILPDRPAAPIGVGPATHR
jgi:hypothetical protein